MARDILKIQDISEKDFKVIANKLYVKANSRINDETGSTLGAAGATPTNVPPDLARTTTLVEVFSNGLRFWEYDLATTTWTHKGDYSAAGGSTTFSGLSDTDITSPAAGSIIYYDGTNWIDLDIGSGNTLLQVNSTGDGFVWVNGDLSGTLDVGSIGNH